MTEPRIVSSDVAEKIGREVRDEFRAALAETRQLSERMDERLRSNPRHSPPPLAATGIKAVR